jgi:hypothetical protein
VFAVLLVSHVELVGGFLRDASVQCQIGFDHLMRGDQEFVTLVREA